MSFGKRLNAILLNRGITAADLSRKLGWNSGVLSQYLNKPDRDPRLSTAVKLADALDVSLDYLAGRTDNPAGMCDEELEGLRIDAEARAMLRGFTLLPPEGRASVAEQVDFQLAKSAKEEMQDRRVPGAA